MKKLFIISLAALIAVTACTKRENTPVEKAVTFQTAALSTRAGIDGPAFPTSESFGVYGWATNNPDGFFMNNERISFIEEDGVWGSNPTFYWPLKATVDFIGYYPHGMSEISVDKNQISFANLDVETSQTDVLYSSKAVGYGYNPDGTYTGIDGSAGVPIVFHHALAKVVVDARTAYDHIEEADGTVYDWEVTLNSVTFSDFYKKGNATFTLAQEPAEGIVDWVKPTDEAGFRVWTNDGSTTSITKVPNAVLNSETPVNVIPEFFVLPQAIVVPPAKDEPEPKPIQKVTVNITVKTRLNGADFIRETYDRSAYIYLEDVPAWNINQFTHYLLIIHPLGIGTGPDLPRPVITFDPAVADWEYITVSTSIAL